VHDIEIDGLDNIDIVNSTIEIETGLGNVDVKYDSSALIDIDPYEYYLTSSGIYTGRLDGDVPTWLADYITTQLSTNEAIDNNAIINILKDRLNNAEIGINQNLQSIQTTNQSLNTLETSVVSRLDDNEADILELDTTKVTADEALAIATNLQVSTFGSDVEAFVSNIVTTYANANLASASDYSLLVATYNDLSVTLTDTRQVVIGETVIWDGIGTPTLGSLYEISGVWYQYLGGSLGPNNDGWVETPTAVNYGQGIDNEAAANRTVKYFSQNTTPTAEGIGDIWMDTNIWYLYSTGTSTSFSDTGFGNVIYIWDGSYWMAQPRQSIDNIANVSWVAYASSLIHAPDGSITGWEYADGSTPYGDTTSQFAIYADNFKLSNGTTGYSPFSVDTINGRINFDGYVSFTGLGIDSDSTTIDGGKLTTNTAWIGGIIQSTNFEWTSGNEPIGFAASGEGIEDPDDIGTYYNIVGGDIYGGNIVGGIVDGAIIRSPNIRPVNSYGREVNSTILQYFYHGDRSYSVGDNVIELYLSIGGQDYGPYNNILGDVYTIATDVIFTFSNWPQAELSNNIPVEITFRYVSQLTDIVMTTITRTYEPQADNTIRDHVIMVGNVDIGDEPVVLQILFNSDYNGTLSGPGTEEIYTRITVINHA